MASWLGTFSPRLAQESQLTLRLEKIETMHLAYLFLTLVITTSGKGHLSYRFHELLY